jgi:L-lactate dehydrogenase complex protein LldE
LTEEPIAVFPTCVVDTVAADVGIAVVRVLRRLGFRVSVPAGTTCCGQPAWNAGFASDAAKVAATTLAALDEVPEGVDVCVPAGSCATMMRVFWPELFHVVGDDRAAERARALAPRIKEFSELVAATTDGDTATGTVAAGVAYHHSCHMLRELGLRQPPLDLLASLEGCQVLDWPGDDRCCGFGGLFSVKQPEISVAMADDKVDGILASGATMVVGCDQSCLLQLEGRLRRRGETIAVKHLAQVLDEAMGGDG